MPQFDPLIISSLLTGFIFIFILIFWVSIHMIIEISKRQKFYTKYFKYINENPFNKFNKLKDIVYFEKNKQKK